MHHLKLRDRWLDPRQMNYSKPAVNQHLVKECTLVETVSQSQQRV